MRSLTERRWLVMPRKIWVLCYTPHERRTCDRIFCKKVKNRNSYLRSIFEEKILIYPTCIFLTYQDEVNSAMGNMTGRLYTPAPVLHWWQKIYYFAKNVATSIKHHVKQLLACFWLCYCLFHLKTASCFLVLTLGTSLLDSRSWRIIIMWVFISSDKPNGYNSLLQ